ncbi:MAG: dienelactone hydrolase family protein [Gammaproteobacteria bacterium]
MNESTNIKINPALGGYVAHPKGTGPFPGVVVMMEAFGITGHIKGVCERLAKAGFVAVAPDIFHGDVIGYAEDMNKVMAKIQTLRDDQIMKEIGETLDWLSAQKNANKDRLGIIGFCMGGRYAFFANCRYPDKLKAAVGFYGGGIAPDGADRFGRTPPINEAEKMRAPLYLGYGADDSGIPPAEHARIAEKLSTLKKRYTLAVYPGAGHGFLCEQRASYAPTAAELAWRECTAFLHTNLENPGMLERPS